MLARLACGPARGSPMEERLLLLALAAVPGLPRHHAHVLLRRFGSAGAVFGRRAAELRAWCAPAAAAALASGPDLAGARAALARACFEFLPARAALDLAGWPDVDIFAH